MCIGSGQPLCPVHRVRRVHSTRVLGKRHSVANLWLYICIYIYTHTICVHIYTGVLTYFIEIERVFAGHGTVEPRFQEARPSVVERMRSALVVLAHSTYPRVHRLKHKCARTFRTILRYFSALWWRDRRLAPPTCARAIMLGYFARLGRGGKGWGLGKDLARENLRRMDWENRLWVVW